MRSVATICLLLATVIPTCQPAQAQVPESEARWYRQQVIEPTNDLIGVELVSCFDADTCTVNIQNLPDVFGRKLPVRLAGIDAPEINGQCEEEKAKALAAKTYLNSRLKHAKVLAFKDATRDKYFRLDVVIIADGKNVNQELVEMGFARPYKGGKRQGWCP